MYKKKYLLINLIFMCTVFFACQNQTTNNTASSTEKATNDKAVSNNKTKDINFQTTVTDKYGGGTKIGESDIQKVSTLTYAIKTINHSSDKNIYTVSMEYPVFEQNTDTEMENRLNKLIYKYIDQGVRNFKIYAIQNNPKGRNDLFAQCKVSEKQANLLRLDFNFDKLHSNKGSERIHKPISLYFDMIEALPKPIID